MLPPNHLYSAHIHNKTDKPITVTVSYNGLGHSETKTQTIAPNADQLFDQVTFETGSSTSVAPIQDVTVAYEGDNASQQRVAPTVQGVNKVKTFHVQHGASGLALNEAH